MFYCKAGDLLVVKPQYDSGVRKVILHMETKPYTIGIISPTKEHYQIPENEIVMALEASVAPFFVSDMIRCLWKEKVVHIRRTHLEYLPNLERAK